MLARNIRQIATALICALAFGLVGAPAMAQVSTEDESADLAQLLKSAKQEEDKLRNI